jgi:malonyl-CoA O-methyltransferase
VYDHDANPLPALEEPVMRRAIRGVCGLDVLDLGCGTGRHALWLAGAGAAVTGVDFSEGMLQKARAKLVAKHVRWLCHDLHSPLPLAGGEFDLVVSGLVLEHLRELDGFFAQIARMLRLDGRAVVSTMHPAMFLRGSMARFTDPNTGELVQPGSIAHSISDFLMAASRAELQLTHIEEVTPDAEFAARYPRAEKYIGWPMLVVMQFENGPRTGCEQPQADAESITAID